MRKRVQEVVCVNFIRICNKALGSGWALFHSTAVGGTRGRRVSKRERGRKRESSACQYIYDLWQERKTRQRKRKRKKKSCRKKVRGRERETRKWESPAERERERGFGIDFYVYEKYKMMDINLLHSTSHHTHALSLYFYTNVVRLSLPLFSHPSCVLRKSYPLLHFSLSLSLSFCSII